MSATIGDLRPVVSCKFCLDEGELGGRAGVAPRGAVRQNEPERDRANMPNDLRGRGLGGGGLSNHDGLLG